MRIHTNDLQWQHLYEALAKAKARGRVAKHVFFDVLNEHRSHSRRRAFEVKLGTYTKIPGDKRRWTNSGNRGANSEANGEGMYAATWDEWGWFLAEVYAMDRDTVAGRYTSLRDFEASTKFQFIASENVPELQDAG